MPKHRLFWPGRMFRVMGKKGERLERKGKNDYSTLCYYIGYFVDNNKKQFALLSNKLDLS